MTSDPQITAAPISLAGGEGETLWSLGGLVTIKASCAQTGGRVAEIPPPPTEAPDLDRIVAVAASFGIDIIGPPGIPE